MKVLNKICSFERWKSYLIIGILVNRILSFSLQAIAFRIGKKGISAWLEVGFNLVGILIGILFLLLSFACYRKQFVGEKDKKEILWVWWKDVVCFWLCLKGLEYIPISLYMYIGLLSPVAAIITGIIILIVFVILLIRATLILVFDLQVENIFATKRKILRKSCKNLGMILATIGILGWFATGESILDFLFLSVIQILGDNFILLLVNEFVFAIVSGWILIIYIEYLTSLRTQIYEDELIVREEGITNRRKTFLYIVTGIMTVFGCCNLLQNIYVNQPLNVEEYIAELMDYAKEEAKYRRTSEAIRIYVQVEDYLKALEAFADDDEEALTKYVVKNPENDFYWRLYYSYSGDMNIAKEKLLESGSDTRLCHDILRHYKQMQKENIEENILADEDNELIEECIQISLSKGAFVDSTLIFHKDSLRNKSINDMKELYEEQLMYNDIFVLLQDSGMKGYVDSATAKQLIQLANENPENKAYQFLAVMGASQYRKDKASHYKDVVVCAKRLDELMKQDTKDMSLLVDEKLYLAQIVMNCTDYKAALDILQDVSMYGNEDIEDSILFCHMELKQNEEVVSYVEKLRANGGDRSILDYMAALSYLKMKNVDKALENGVLLAQKVAVGGDEREKNNTLLYSLAEYLCIQDSYKGYIDYQCRVKEYTETQRMVLNESKLLKNYVDAMNAVYNSKNIEVALSALDNIEETEPNLSTVWFLRGTVYFDKGQYDEAIECFHKCISIDENNITATYSLAVLYDIKKDYEASAKMCEQILNIMPTVNHELDWYGITYHTKALYEAIQKYVGGTR